MADNFNLTGIWEARSSSNGEPYTSEMELVHHGDRVMGKEVGGRTEYFLEGNVVGTSVTLYYFGMYGEKPMLITYRCQFCGKWSLRKEWKNKGQTCPKCERDYDWRLAQDSE